MARAVDTPFSAILSSLRAPTPKGAGLLSDLGAVTPVVVYTGPTRSQAELANLSAIEAATPHHKKKAAAKSAAAKPADEKAADEKTANGKATDQKAGEGKAADVKVGDGKATDGKAKTKPWTPMSASTLAASPPPGLETKSTSDKPKKPKKAEAAPKPARRPLSDAVAADATHYELILRKSSSVVRGQITAFSNVAFRRAHILRQSRSTTCSSKSRRLNARFWLKSLAASKTRVGISNPHIV